MMESGGRRSGGILARIPWRGLLVLALLLTAVRIFFCTVLRVPSGSMEPTLHGDLLRGDELLVFKPSYHLASPERFDLVVFNRKGDDVKSDERVAVKRVVATGGETVRIDDGDLYVAPPQGTERRLVKGYREFRRLLVPLMRETFDAGVETRLLAAHDGRTRFERGGVTLTGEAELTDAASIALDSGACRFDDGWIDDRRGVHEGQNPVRDVLFELEVELEHPTLVLVFTFALGSDELKFTLMPMAPGHALEFARVPSVGAPFEDSMRFRQVTPGKKHRLEFWQVDGSVGFAVDGRVEFETPLPGSSRAVSLGADVRSVNLLAYHGSVRITGWNVWRDLLYTEPGDATFGTGGQPYEVPEGELFVLGDCSFDSVDSRHFGSIAEADLVGKPLFVVAPASRLRWLR